MSIAAGDRLLLECLKGRAFPPPDDKERWREVVGRSIRHGVAPCLHRTVKDSGVDLPADERNLLQRLYLEAAGANAGLFHELGTALRVLKNAQIPVIVLKGAHLAESFYGDIALRPMCDVDLLVKRSDLARAQEVLLEAGYPPHGKRFPLDLHWSLNDAHPDLAVDMEALWERAVPIRAAGVDVLGLSDEDLVAYVCTHFSYQHLFASAGLRTLLDLRQILGRSRASLKWGLVGARAGEWNNMRGVVLALELARGLLEVDVPEGAFALHNLTDVKDSEREWALDQVFGDKPVYGGRELSPYFWQLWGEGTWREKLGHIRKLLFPAREIISQKYPAPVGSKRNLLYYAVRFREHTRDYAGALWRLFRRDRSVLAVAERRNRDISMRERLQN